MDKSELNALGIEDEAAEKVMEMTEAMKNEYESRIKEIERENKINDMLRKSGAKNVKAVRALIELSGEEDAEEEARQQIEMLKENEETCFLFKSARRSFEPGYSSQKLPDSRKSGYEARLASARENGNTVAAIRIKQEAAADGIVLM